MWCKLTADHTDWRLTPMVPEPTAPPRTARGLPILRALATQWVTTPPAVKAALYMLSVTMLLAGMHTIIRHVSANLHPFEISFFRSFFGLLVFLPIFLRDGVGVLRTNKLAWHIGRGVVQTGAMLMFFTALSILPLAKVSALSFTSPLFTSVFAIVLLGERVRLRRTAALLIGFAGVLIIVWPGSVGIEAGTLLVLGSSALWAFALITVKRLSEFESSVTIVVYMNLTLTVLTLVPALLVWQWPTGAEFLWLFAVGAIASTAHIAMTQALRHADTTAIMPYEYTRLIWAGVLGFIVFAEVPSVLTIVGGVVIAASTLYIAFREAQVRDEEPVAVPPLS